MKSRRQIMMTFHLTTINMIHQITKKKPEERRWWVRPSWLQRDAQGDYKNLVKTLANDDPEYFHTFLRVTPREFRKLKNLLRPALKRFPAGRKALSVGHQLAITLRFLASGDSLRSISFAFRIGFSTAHVIIMRTCDALWNVLQPLVLPPPTPEIWQKTEELYESKWNFPRCVGAADGKHVEIEAPHSSGSMFYNYKQCFSIVLMALVDGNYKFLVVDIGAYGSNSDGGIWKNSEFGRAYNNGQVNVPAPKPLPGTRDTVDPVIIGDEGFELRPTFLRPFPGAGLTNERRIFNYRLSRARRCSENAFGILGARFRILRKPLALKVENCNKVVKACIVVHNFLMKEAEIHESAYCPPNFADRILPNGDVVNGRWRTEDATNLASIRAANRRCTLEGEEVREKFKNYFSGVGAVPWQYEKACIV